MAKAKTIYSCTECGGQTPKWQGQCPHCEAWNTLVESVAEVAVSGKNRFSALTAGSKVQRLAEVEAAEVPRTPTGIMEFDRVLGGGTGAGRGGADRRRPRHRQIHAVVADAGASLHAQKSAVCQRRGIDAADRVARQAA